MQRRSFLKGTAALLTAVGSARADSLRVLGIEDWIDLRQVVIITPASASAREKNAARVLAEEAGKRCGLDWIIRSGSEAGTGSGAVTIYVGTRASWAGFGKEARSRLSSDVVRITSAEHGLPAEGFALGAGKDVSGHWIAILGADERGLLFGVGKLLRTVEFSRQSARIDAGCLNIRSSPRYPLRGHQLGYRPKTNSYDGWTVEMWDQYIRELAIFGANAIELLPPHTDDQSESPHFSLPPGRMMAEMSRIADDYGLDVWVWYPAMDRDYSDPKTVDSAVREWAQTLEALPRVDAVFVPGGDPGHTEPKHLLALLEKQKKSLRRAHPRLQMWVSPQGFDSTWLPEFIDLVKDPHTSTFLDGIVYGPACRISLAELHHAISERYPIRFYPDITHSQNCQYPVPDWDVAFALTEGREIVNPRPKGEANILRLSLPQTIGFITYSEGCNDDVNKFLWSALGWAPDQSIESVLRDFSQFFIGTKYADSFAQGLMNLEENWRGPLAINDQVDITLAGFRDMEDSASPALLQNWRFQQALYRAYTDSLVRRRLLNETEQLLRARDLLSHVRELGWIGNSAHPVESLSNQQEPNVLLEEAIRILSEPAIQHAGGVLRTRVLELASALFQSIHMQLAVERYQAEAPGRGANLDSLDAPVTDVPWMRRQLKAILRIAEPVQQVNAIRELLSRTDPGPGGFYDELGNMANRPHLVSGQGSAKDPEFRHTPMTQYAYPDRLGAMAPVAWKCWVGSLFTAPIELLYEGLDPRREFRLRVVYAGNNPHLKISCQANDHIEIHPYIERAWPTAPQEFTIPREATSSGTLKLSWTREDAPGYNPGCQIAEVWLLPIPDSV